MSEELCRMPAAVLCKRIARRDVSPVEVMQAILDHCERLQPTLNCFITPRADNRRLSDEWERTTRFSDEEIRRFQPRLHSSHYESRKAGQNNRKGGKDVYRFNWWDDSGMLAC